VSVKDYRGRLDGGVNIYLHPSIPLNPL
jgi:hypothetical protein